MGAAQSSQEMQDIVDGLQNPLINKQTNSENSVPEKDSLDDIIPDNPGVVNVLVDFSTTILSTVLYIVTYPFQRKTTRKKIKVVNWNLLADGLADDGFVTPITLPATREFEQNVLTLTDSKKTINGFEKLDNAGDMVESWKNDHPEFAKYQDKLLELLVWHTDAAADFDKCSSRDDMDHYIKNVAYPGRGPVFTKTLELMKPDIITMEEMDKYQYFLENLSGYTSAISDDSQYQRVKFSSVGKSRGEMVAISSTDDYEAYMAQKTHAFMPKLNSNAYSFNNNRTQIPKLEAEQSEAIGKANSNPDEPDNDGSCIFWNKEKYNCQEIDYHRFHPDYELKKGIYKSAGVVYARLVDKSDGTILHVFSTHLTSGNKPADEVERVKEISSTMEFIKSKTTDGYVILGMDGNSYQGFCNGEFDVQTNMYSNLKAYGLKNYDPVQPDDERYITWSVNKIRGIFSGQIKKIGDYQLDRIDYIATNGNLVQVEDSDQMKQETKARTVRYGQDITDSQKKEIYGKMLPNMLNPSDHLPCVASFELQ